MTRKSRGDAWRTGLGCLSQPCLCIAYDHPEYRDVSQAVAASFFEVVKEPISYLFFFWCRFQGAHAFTGLGLETWNVANVNDMQNMFYQANMFNGDLSSWDVSSVTTMQSMVSSALLIYFEAIV